MEDKTVFPAKSRKYNVIVEGKRDDAHIRCTGEVPFSVSRAVSSREGNGMKNSFESLSFLAKLLTA